MAKAKSRDYPLPPSDDLLKYKTPMGSVTMDTTGYSAGRKRFPIKAEGVQTGLYGRQEPVTVYGTVNRKGATRAIEYSQGKSKKRVAINPDKRVKKSFQNKNK